MVEPVLGKGTIPFQVEGRLLQELGERLVASPEVALVELIKNAYDADSPTCTVRLEKAGKSLVIADEGHGMTFLEFSSKWMRIATSSKVAERLSPKYKRRLTGAKGIGRFAVRYLGNQLTLITIADDPKLNFRTKLTATFDWLRIDRVGDIRNAEIDYKLEQVGAEAPVGTTLQVDKLKTSTNFTRKSSLRAAVLRIVTPLQGLDAGRFERARQSLRADPGFKVALPGDKNEGSGNLNLAKFVLDNYWARLQINLDNKHLTFKITIPSSRAKTFELNVPSAISAGFTADIRYFPRRKGVFQQKGIDGQEAWRWVRENGGVAVVDHGFRVVPYGYESDDWLHLDVDKTRHERNWRSHIARRHFPIPDAIRKKPAQNPTFYIPNNLQLVGAVFVESKPLVGAKNQEDLTPSMDREGFLKNRGLEQLTEFVRAGVEFLALQDKRELERRKIAEAREAAQDARDDVRQAIEHIKDSPTLTASDKATITKAYLRLADQIEEVEEYNEKARQNLITMSLLGVVASFMTHESKSLIFEMEKAAQIVDSLAKKNPALKGVSAELNRRLLAFKGQLEYAQLFLKGVRRGQSVRMSAAGQIRYVLKRFGSFATDHGIEVLDSVRAKTETPLLTPAVYSGVILNLYSNALKAVLSATSSIDKPKISINAWNDNGSHILEVSDNGIGIPPQLRKRIWDPLYTTTSDTGNPLGSGMGLGLSLVKHVVEDSGGKISLVNDPPAGFNTSFRVVFPLE